MLLGRNVIRLAGHHPRLAGPQTWLDCTEGQMDIQKDKQTNGKYSHSSGLRPPTRAAAHKAIWRSCLNKEQYEQYEEVGWVNTTAHVQEAVEIRRNQWGTGHGLNEDMGSYVKTDIWDPILHTMDSCNWKLMLGFFEGGRGPSLDWVFFFSVFDVTVTAVLCLWLLLSL